MRAFSAAILAAVASAVKTKEDYADYMSADGAFDYSSYMNNFGPTYSGTTTSGTGATHGHQHEPVVTEYVPTHGDFYGDYHNDEEHYDDYHYDDHHYDDFEESHHSDDHDHHDDHHDDHHHDVHDDHHYVEPQEEPHYEDAADYVGGDVPTGDFWHQVDEFNEWNEIWDQDSYEHRLEQEAELMVALEALREDLVHLDHDIDDLDDCISHNDEDISENDEGINYNDHEISDNDHEISDQESRIERLQRQCRRNQDELDEDRDFLVLHCQQFAFAKDMVGACADILTCRGTDLAYRSFPAAQASHH